MSDAMSDGVVEAFLTDLGAWADPTLAAPLIAPGLRAETAQRLLASPRLTARASRLLLQHVGQGDPATLEPVDLALASAASAMLETVALYTGAVWHARRVRALVLGAEIALLSTRLGDDTRRAALRHAALAPGEGQALAASGGNADNANTLADDIEHDGARCMAAWIDTLPDWTASRVRLKWRGGFDFPAADATRAYAARVVRTLAAEALAT